MKTNIVKIVYFDEGSATDYIQIHNGGSLYCETSDESSRHTRGSIEGKGGVGIGSKIQALLFKGYAQADGALGVAFREDAVMKSVITNTVLTDFLEIVEGDGDRQISVLENLRIGQIAVSLSSFSLLTPYFSMFKGGQGIPAGDFTIAVDKLDSTLSSAKGYFEFLGSDKEESRVILRFNGAAFKNNYRPSNLLNMNLKLCAVCVGEGRLSDLRAEKELEVESVPAETDPDYAEASTDPIDDDDKLPMYDVILAGVSANG